ncbi:hypothetical protein [Halothermothrix orenii]|nr:hypothetical protein [Halothermothrix orenii]
MNQLNQIENNLRQLRQNINSMINQINHQISSSEQLIRNLRNQPGQTSGQNQYQPQQNYGEQYQGQYTTQPQQYGFNSTQNQSGTSYEAGQPDRQGSTNPISGLSENSPTMQQRTGVNQYGAQYTSGKDKNEEKSNRS